MRNTSHSNDLDGFLKIFNGIIINSDRMININKKGDEIIIFVDGKAS